MTQENDKPSMSQLPPDLLGALVKFRAENGRTWKHKLLSGWLRAAFPGELQRLRNDFGPEWLAGVKDAEFDKLAEVAPNVKPGAGIRGHEAPGILSEASYKGEFGNKRHLTRKEIVIIPVSALAHMRGARGERRGFTVDESGRQWFGNYEATEWEKFKTDLAQNGMSEPVTINIDVGEEVCIYEGNHRVQAALQSGWNVIAADIRYYGGAETTFDGGSFFRQAMGRLEEDNAPKASSARPRM
ncbi:hypothetical protein [Burkholderia ubonensis]|uniref:hypothetical protein n=1 Tax=Burkholderia ubonensis TaxID=101571 RepID=UPI0007564DDE|nr:hypothetical protein [Burkholderia ubonensis]KVO15209.1 hypothetical protein WJ74_11195 [Burkholderia ubonensis]KVT07369.1 hypothetical protein WK46_10575 [Burkholderia ubonensis]